MLRMMIALLLLSVPSALATTPTPESMREMPVMVLYCESDPDGVQVGGGKDPAPEQLIASGQCTPAEGVALTFVLVRDDFDFETSEPEDDWDIDANSWFARCDMDAEGRCQLTSPGEFNNVLGVFLHDATVKPGYEPANFRTTTINATEFAGYGLALIPTADTNDTVGEVADHQTLALNITSNGKPASVLTEWDIDDAHDDADMYLATNAEGWVSAITAPKQKVEIELVNMPDSAHVTAACSANDDASVKVTVQVDENDLEIAVPDTSSDIRCDVQVEEHAS